VSVGAAGFVLIMAGRTGWDLVVYAASAVLDLAVALVLVPRLGINGAAIAQAVTIAASNWLRLVLVRRYVGIFPWDREYARLALPAAACAVAMLVTHSFTSDAVWYVDLAAVGVIGGLVYLPALLAFGLAPQDKAGLGKVLARVRG
jgi:O-antigen/teichoic acid export membrane protein